jgi:3-oxoacyl-[acyl-carrier-protein] synthase II
MTAKRVVITGLGVVAPNGIGKDVFWNNCLEGISGVKAITAFDTAEYNTKIAAVINDFDPSKFIDKITTRRSDRFAQFALAASVMAMKDSGMEKVLPKETGVCIGTGLGGMFFAETQIVRVINKGNSAGNPASIPAIMPNSVSNQISIMFNAQGPNMTVCTACSSGTHSIGQAFDTIRQGRAEVIIAGGADSPITQYNFLGFDKLNVMSKRNEDPTAASRPFDKDRDGFVMGEGAAVLILESFEHAKKRNARIYAEVKSYSTTSGAYHIVMPRPDATDIARAMQICLDEAGIDYSKVDYINAHGTSTKMNDKAETKGIKKVFKEYAYKIPVSSTKSMIGHSLGASGAIEAVACVLSIQDGKIHPTINLDNQDPDCDLDYVPRKYREKNLNYVLSNSFGFGNNNACLLFSKCE